MNELKISLKYCSTIFKEVKGNFLKKLSVAPNPKFVGDISYLQPLTIPPPIHWELVLLDSDLVQAIEKGKIV